MRLVAQENQAVGLGVLGRITVALIVEVLQAFRVGQALLDHVARHQTAGLLGVEADDLELAVLLVLEHRSHYAALQGAREVGKDTFAAFLERMDRCYSERVEDLVILASQDGSRAAAEFTVHGCYLATDEGLPPATGQTYALPAGAFFSIADGKIARVTMYYNLADWTRQVAGK